MIESLSRLVSIAAENCQVILTTHSYLSFSRLHLEGAEWIPERRSQQATPEHS
jgi:predicted ATPase